MVSVVLSEFHIDLKRERENEKRGIGNCEKTFSNKFAEKKDRGIGQQLKGLWSRGGSF